MSIYEEGLKHKSNDELIIDSLTFIKELLGDSNSTAHWRLCEIIEELERRENERIYHKYND